ncbi:hypothetical protein VNO78_28746 [Psophocarpus tetragonolobus]|uniref:Uncharacterized protein n=1 Tax=Psophocarpus tetragonolobus TaxID=3891 RepID=A0AAN9RU34_PSOTE
MFLFWNGYAFLLVESDCVHGISNLYVGRVITLNLVNDVAMPILAGEAVPGDYLQMSFSSSGDVSSRKPEDLIHLIVNRFFFCSVVSNLGDEQVMFLRMGKQWLAIIYRWTIRVLSIHRKSRYREVLPQDGAILLRGRNCGRVRRLSVYSKQRDPYSATPPAFNKSRVKDFEIGLLIVMLLAGSDLNRVCVGFSQFHVICFYWNEDLKKLIVYMLSLGMSFLCTNEV